MLDNVSTPIATPVYFEWDGGNPLLFYGTTSPYFIDGLRVIMPMRV